MTHGQGHAVASKDSGSTGLKWDLGKLETVSVLWALGGAFYTVFVVWWDT